MVTVLLYSFELVRRQSSKRTQTVMRLHNHRFLHLCQLLAANSDKFVWTTFRELPLDEITANLAPLCLRSSLSRTLRRYCEQAATRLVMVPWSCDTAQARLIFNLRANGVLRCAVPG